MYSMKRYTYRHTHTHSDIESSWNILNLKSRTGRTIEFLLKKKGGGEYTQRGKKSGIKIL